MKNIESFLLMNQANMNIVLFELKDIYIFKIKDPRIIILNDMLTFL